MILEILLALNLNICPKTKIIGAKEYGWTAYDEKILNNARTRCEQLYKKSPCVKMFIKSSKTSYQVVCGKTLNKTRG
jgi:hypothetical protein